MNKLILTAIIAFLFSTTQAFSQTIDLSTDSIEIALCKKWEIDYAILGNMKIGRMPGAAESNYEFNKDKTFTLTGKDPKDKSKGTWVYDKKSKTIKLTLNGRSNTNIISLKEGELIMLTDTKEATPNDPMEIKVVYKIKAG
ncbi:hypothetical protein [Paraflavitalea sp. CAU 1676]|uniref:hypothetical protein n=1 Tax=Paraflavitalea sp. CAU 1676 TaxID=3032598 RepID=UPI0023DAB07A|nr:hypothetical protein [Paraflavitalea sp. CAU 1676]MDF2193457.1 hypothetical protein [Paraflavitalea sp. CAU 1676]